MIKKMYAAALGYMALMAMLTGCRAQNPGKADPPKAGYANWDQVVAAGKGTTVSFAGWGGNEAVNTYLDVYVAGKLKSLYGITLKRIPMNAPDFLTKLINEKKASSKGTLDIVWINGENFLAAKEGGLLYGPFTSLLPNQKKYYDTSQPDFSADSGVAIQGLEAPWGAAQLVFTYDSAIVATPPEDYKQFLGWAKKHPGKFTYPNAADDFAGTSFVKGVYYDLSQHPKKLAGPMTKEAFDADSAPVFAYLKELAPYLWSKGESYPATQAQQDLLFQNGEVDFTMGFEVGKTAGLIGSGVYPNTAKTYLPSPGTIGNSHYLAIPANAANKAGALLAIDFLQSPEAQIEKMSPKTWGDMSLLDGRKLDGPLQDKLKKAEENAGDLTLQQLSAHRIPEFNPQVTEWIKETWKAEIGS